MGTDLPARTLRLLGTPTASEAHRRQAAQAVRSPFPGAATAGVRSAGRSWRGWRFPPTVKGDAAAPTAHAPPATVCALSGEGPPHIQRGKDACVRAHACDHVHVCVRVQAWAGTRVSMCASVYHQEPQTDPSTWVLGAGQALLPVTCGAGLGRRPDTLSAGLGASAPTARRLCGSVAGEGWLSQEAQDAQATPRVSGGQGRPTPWGPGCELKVGNPTHFQPGEVCQ